MLNRNVTKIFTLVFITLFSIGNASGCECDMPIICESYSKAKKVFVGRLEKVVKDEKAKVHTIQAYFSVEATYKGKTAKTEIVTFRLGDCVWIDLREGKKYFVYAEESNINSYCNRTNSLSAAKADLDYAKSLSATKPIFTIRGYIPKDNDNTNIDFNALRLSVKVGNEEKIIRIDKNGFFNLVVTKNENYEVNLLAPFKANILVMRSLFGGDLPVSIANIGLSTRLTYNLQFKPNECDSRVIRIFKNELGRQ